jgi:hypothetical protein
MAVSATRMQSQLNAPIQVQNREQGKYSTWVPSIAAKVKFLMLPALALVTMSFIPGADAGPLSYSACCIACSVSLPPAIPACLAWCSAFLFFPSP